MNLKLFFQMISICLLINNITVLLFCCAVCPIEQGVINWLILRIYRVHH